MSPLRSSISFSFKNHEKKSLRGSFLRARRDTYFYELARALLSAAQSQCSHRSTAATPRIAPALPRRARSCVDRLSFFINGGSTSRLLCAKPAAPTQMDENEHDCPHIRSESQVVITTDTCPIDSRALGVGWVAWFDFPCYGPALRVGRTQKKMQGRARAIATTGALCLPALGESGACPVVSGGVGEAENRNAPNSTAALSFVENSEAARYVFVVCDRRCHDRRPSLPHFCAGVAWWARAMPPGAARPVGGVLGVRPDGGWSTAASRGSAGRVV